jgi:hypothetical protein
MFELSPFILARIQFAFTISFHIIFPAFTIGLASYLAVLEGFWLKTNNTVYQDLYKFWIKIFAVAFGMGVVSGVVMSYQLGTNWSIFSDKIANVLGPIIGFEVLTAFFLEASFLGVMLFGWGRVSKKMHFTHWENYGFYKPEHKISKETRLDGVFCINRADLENPQALKHFIEIKNTTYVEKVGDKLVAMFPDAVTERGQKHLRETHRSETSNECSSSHRARQIRHKALA